MVRSQPVVRLARVLCLGVLTSLSVGMLLSVPVGDLHSPRINVGVLSVNAALGVPRHPKIKRLRRADEVDKPREDQLVTLVAWEVAVATTLA